MLAISTATKKAYIGLDFGGKKCFGQVDANCKQAENVLVKINELLEQNDVDINQIENMAVVIGPGSFTGLRIGVALVKGLCAAQERNIIAISSLDFMAREVLKNQPKRDFVCAIDALSGLVYVKEFDSSGKPLSEDKIISREEFDLLDKEKYGLEEENVCQNKIVLSCETLLEIAFEKSENGEFENVKTLEPVYLRKSQAEENFKKNQKTN